MIIELMNRQHNFCSIVASTHEHVYNAWKRGNTLHLYILSNEEKETWPTFRDVVSYLTVRIEAGEIQLIAENEALTLYSHNELINTIRGAFHDDWHDIVTIIDTLLYVE